MVAAAVGIGGAVSGIGGIIGSSESASAQKQAAATEAAATQAAIQAEQTQFQTGLGYTAPFATEGQLADIELASELGTSGIGVGNAAYGSLDAPPSLTDVSKLPGYQFTLTQGEEAAANAAAAQGLGQVYPTAQSPANYGSNSGPEGKGLVSYAEGLANTFYNNYLSNYWTNQNNRYNMLAGLTNTGATTATSIQGAAVNTGQAQATSGLSGTTAANNLTVGAANTQAAGITGAANSLGSNLLLATALGNTGTTIGGGNNPGNTGNLDVGGPGVNPQ